MNLQPPVYVVSYRWCDSALLVGVFFSPESAEKAKAEYAKGLDDYENPLIEGHVNYVGFRVTKAIPGSIMGEIGDGADFNYEM